MYLLDWNDFIADRPWFATDHDTVETEHPILASEGLFQPTAGFVATFPVLTRLLNLARITKVKFNNRIYHLHGWTDRNAKSLGWLCLPPCYVSNNHNLHMDHALLLTSLGGITERWNEPADTWLLNLNSALCPESEAESSFWRGCYLDICKGNGLQPVIDPTDYAAFAFEANGDCAIYHRVTGQALMFVHDPSLINLVLVPGCPEGTLYTIKGCPDLRTWVEIVAHQWLAHL